ncbi:Sugar (and other) transporter family protein [Leishmania donovani]|uniref:Sugar (And other) transporter family protein n=1 Tax=Leishmania donovani TaxID=5661 RepID=A0A504XWY5_LEIDO|nr:Sugar (and other) transporter family protein [Leishmania donovani]
MSDKLEANRRRSNSDKEPIHDLAKKNVMEDEGDAPPFMSASNAKVMLVQAIGGSLNGYSIGFVGVYSTLFGYSTNCANFRSERGCTTAPNADCQWFPNATGTGYCGWPEITCRRTYTYSSASEMPGAITQCEADPRCRWSYSAKECQNPSGYSSSESGIFAGSMIAGCLIGSVFAGPLASTIGARLSFCSLASWNAHPKWKRTIGVMFQCFTTLGISLRRRLALHLARASGLTATRTDGDGAHAGPVRILDPVQPADDPFGGDDEEAALSWTRTSTANSCLAPLVGNFVVMLWNFVTTLASIPLSYVFTMRQLFLFGSLFTSSMCLLMCGIPVYPGVSKKTEVKNGVAITGILLFILGFEVCVARATTF